MTTSNQAVNNAIRRMAGRLPPADSPPAQQAAPPIPAGNAGTGATGLPESVPGMNEIIRSLARRGFAFKQGES